MEPRPGSPRTGDTAGLSQLSPKRARSAAQPPGVTRISILGKESICIGVGLLDYAGAIAHDACKAARYAVVTDANVAKLHLPQLLASFREAGQVPIVKVLPPGESTKCRAVKDEIEDWLLENRCGRDCAIVALGGGVIGDLTGYVAACFMRGVKVVQVPTTLLAMVDSSVGGKTGIDTPHGKNLIGAFHHPTRIIMDLNVLGTLPDRQLCNGMAEVVKTAILWDAARFDQLEAHVDEVLAKDRKWLREIVVGSAGIKAEVVTRDEKEGGLRTLLNVGHSVGHAIEAYLAPGMLHGEAVSIGMVKEGEISRRLGHISQGDLARIARCLQAYRLPTTMPRGLSVEGLMGKMAVDKKNKGGKKYISLVERIGKCYMNTAVAIEDPDIEVALARGVIIKPIAGKALSCEVSVPGSKSVSNRALLIAALGSGRCELTGLLHSDDTQVMLDALQTLDACTCEWKDGGRTLVITGNGGKMKAPAEGTEIYLGNAGTASRFLTTAVAAAEASPGRSYTTLTGNKRMRERPIQDLVTALRAAGVHVDFLDSEGCLPLRVRAGGLPGGEISLSAKVSSQYVSSVLISAPYAAKPVSLQLEGAAVSKAYIDMTLKVMKDFGVAVAEQGQGGYAVPRQPYRNPKAYRVEADASSATYPLAIAAAVGDTAAVTVPGIGSGSIQGDAAFALLLGRMGCSVEQTADKTTVRGPAGRLKAVAVDMEPMTDAFMTAAVLMAIADGTSRITGIANQRVKECNRILAMVTELGKLGVPVRELPDGLEIDGVAPEQLRPARIHCYDDHRIAMSFAVLGCRVPGITIDDKACVEKTYPEFWDHLQRHFGVELSPADDDARGSAESPEASVVLIGMRGAGKTLIGQHCAQRLGWRFVDSDDRLEAALGCSLADYVARDGWAAFREAEAAELGRLLSGADAQGCVIACGGGIVETKAGREVLRRSRRVIHIDKSLAGVEAALGGGGDARRPAWGEPLEKVYARRRPLYNACSRFTLQIADGEADWGAVCRDAERLCRFVAHGALGAQGQPPVAATAGGGRLRSFLSLTLPDLSAVVPLLPELEGGVDALEVRVDLLDAAGDPQAVSRQVALLRRHSLLPIVYTVRSVQQGGRFSAGPEKALELMEAGRRCGCEFIDVETSELPPAQRDAFIERAQPQAQIIASFHDPKGEKSLCELRDALEEGALCGKVDFVKLVGTAKSVDDCFRLREMMRGLDLPGSTQAFGILMGLHGQLSRALNDLLTPVTHPLMPVKAAPGQLSMREINAARVLCGMLPPRKFYLFGSPIQHSKSPTIHNAGFEELGMAGWGYELCETASAEEVRRVAAQPDFGGGSVTIPLKLDVLPLCSELSEAAERIGAVNTLIKLPCGGLRGDNTDWLGMRDCALRAGASAPRRGLCIGAGGSARAAMWALRGLGVEKPLVWNRTHSKAVALAADFGGEAIADLSQLSESPDVIISNVPGDTQGAFVAAVAPHLRKGSVVIEMAYKPRVTDLVKEARQRGAGIVEGIDILVEQGLYQWREFTGLNPPRAAIRRAVDRRLAEEAKGA
eukprot:TRINITY_DN24049_c0_g1_i1.p1 TRINITY_DN24049_c0_g1~~TRINITY_DN24049_c0_g1_i1.p1  ORF type:complete len:1542 (+),score=476.87 TRINITY_DN24049_c0_g1_i1:100-4725(+)